ncbi:unnamed protein product [Polarella glacialis]|uniref:Glycosyltransferase 61 catalytic domain-containing protein n=1 Tax=Polarella glacialis TaxID=89957 RepID=A0A813DDS8_POLGL|nr:unnamed protein product [Polarella glacialis]
MARVGQERAQRQSGSRSKGGAETHGRRSRRPGLARLSRLVAPADGRDDEEFDTDEEDLTFCSHSWPSNSAARLVGFRCCTQRRSPCPGTACSRLAVGLTLLFVNGALLVSNLGFVMGGATELEVSRGAGDGAHDSDGVGAARSRTVTAMSRVAVPQRPTLPPNSNNNNNNKHNNNNNNAGAQVRAGPRSELRRSGTAKGSSQALWVDEAADLSKVDVLLAEALLSNQPSTLSFWTPNWAVQRDSAQKRKVPYESRYRQLNKTHGEYLRHENLFFVSPCSAHELEREDHQFGDPLWEKAVFKRSNCSESEKAANAASKRLVVYINLRESGYFGHAVDNVLPRLGPLLGGARLANSTVTLVLPPLGRRSLSPSTTVLCKALGIELRQKIPAEPHRTVGVSGVATWDRVMRLALRAAVRASPLLRGVVPATCSAAISAPAGLCPGGGVFLGRGSGVRNRRQVLGSQHLEAAFQGQGFEVIDDAGAVPLEELAARLFGGACCLAGFFGTALINLIFLPPGASLIEFNPYNMYGDFWQWTQALADLNYRHFELPKNITKEEGQKWTRLALAAG